MKARISKSHAYYVKENNDESFLSLIGLGDSITDVC